MNTPDGKNAFLWISVILLSCLTLGFLVWLDVRPEPTLCDLAVSGDLEKLKTAIEAQPDLNALCPNGQPPLACAVEAGQLDAVNMLLEAGAAVNGQSSTGLTPLYYALEQNSSDLIICLLDAGANPHIQNQNGISPFYLAVQRDHPAVSVFLERGFVPDDAYAPDREGFLFCSSRSGCMPVLERLLERTPDVNCKSAAGMTALQYAVYGSQLDAAQLLIDHGADVNQVDRHGWSPLHVAAREENTAFINLLEKCGAELETEDRRGYTPLLMAAMKGHLDAVRKLVTLGADINAKNSENRSVEDLARAGNYPEIVHFMRKHRDELKHRGQSESIVF